MLSRQLKQLGRRIHFNAQNESTSPINSLITRIPVKALPLSSEEVIRVCDKGHGQKVCSLLQPDLLTQNLFEGMCVC